MVRWPAALTASSLSLCVRYRNQVAAHLDAFPAKYACALFIAPCRACLPLPVRYLEALILWRLLSFALWPLRRAHVLLLAFLLAHLGGYVEFGEGGALSYDHAVGFLPYFLAGWSCPLNALMVAVPRTPRTMTAGGLLMLALPMVLVSLEPLPDNHGVYSWFWARSEFEETLALARHGEPLAYRLYWTRRAAKNVIEIAQALAVLLTLVSSSECR